MPFPSHPPWLDHSNYAWRRHKATLNAHNQESGTPSGTQTEAIQKIRKHPTSSKLMIITTTCHKSTIWPSAQCSRLLKKLCCLKMARLKHVA
jgi:hypothetical protein